MREKTKKIVNVSINILGSRYFLWGIIALFVLQALWIAFSFRYSMIYDEYYHFGLIQHFSHQWLPWINNQPTSLDQYGALGRNPYLLYHYLMSFPFRIVSLCTNNFAIQVISMRILNIALFASGLFVFERLFRLIKIQSIFRNLTLLFFVLLPVTPFVASTVNYDNAIFLLTALFMLVGVKIIKEKTVKWYNYMLIVFVGMVGSLMKVSFIPIFAAGFAYFLVDIVIRHKKMFFHNFYQSLKSTDIWLKLIIIVPIIVVSFLFIERFGDNITQYHSLSPSCTRQMSKGRCISNYVEQRAEDLKNTRTGRPVQITQYASTWTVAMESGLLVTGANTKGKFGTVTGQPLPVIYIVMSVVIMFSVAAFFYSLDKIKKIRGFWFMIGIVFLYVTALFYKNATSYYEYYQPIAIQGRYLVPLLPIFMLFALLSINNVFREKRTHKLVALLIVFALYLNGAGLITHIVRSDDSWNWDNQTVRRVNDSARNALKPFIKE